METLKDFINTFIEINAFMLLWCKFSLKKENILFKNIAIASICAFILANTYPINHRYAVALSYIAMVCLISFFYKERLVKSLLGFCVILIFIMILQLILIHMAQFIFLLKEVDSFIFDAGIQSIILFISMILYYFVSDKRTYNMNVIDFKILPYIIINLIAYILICKMLWQYNKNLILNNIIIFTTMLMLMFILNLLLCYNIVKMNEEKKMIEVHNKYNPIIENIMEEVRRKQHDFKNYLNTINGIVQVSKEEELKENLTTYIKSLDSFTKNIENIIYINDGILRAIIYSKLCDAEKKHVNFSYQVNNNLLKWKIKNYELSDVITNLLNNAFEAVENNLEKTVILNIYKEENKNIIELKNSWKPINTDNIKHIFSRGFSTKNGENRGYGLYNIKKIVESNGGGIQLSFDELYISFIISF